MVRLVLAGLLHASVVSSEQLDGSASVGVGGLGGRWLESLQSPTLQQASLDVFARSRQGSKRVSGSCVGF